MRGQIQRDMLEQEVQQDRSWRKLGFPESWPWLPSGTTGRAVTPPPLPRRHGPVGRYVLRYRLPSGLSSCWDGLLSSQRVDRHGRSLTVDGRHGLRLRDHAGTAPPWGGAKGAGNPTREPGEIGGEARPDRLRGACPFPFSAGPWRAAWLARLWGERQLAVSDPPCYPVRGSGEAAGPVRPVGVAGMRANSTQAGAPVGVSTALATDDIHSNQIDGIYAEP